LRATWKSGAAAKALKCADRFEGSHTVNRLYQFARRVKNSSPLLQHVYAQYINLRRKYARTDYSAKLTEETDTYKDEADINRLPAIFDYWSNKYLVPMLSELEVGNPDEFFAKYLHEGARATQAAHPVFVSLGAGNCDTEVRVARLLLESGLARFTLECVDMNPHMLARGRQLAQAQGVERHLTFAQTDLNAWKPAGQYSAMMANQSLHHMLNLEGVFDEVRRALQPSGYFVVSDIIGRNGHQRWPEALKAVRRFWKELPRDYRFNQQLERQETVYENWDCSHEAFEGIRAQDILPSLMQRFHFRVFFGFCNAIDVFIDRSFGHHFDPARDWDRDFIDRVHAFDEASLLNGELTPTHMMAVLCTLPAGNPVYVRGLTPEQSLRPGSYRSRYTA
jgi:SAM-dependent methyltransferase